LDATRRHERDGDRSARAAGERRRRAAAAMGWCVRIPIWGGWGAFPFLPFFLGKVGGAWWAWARGARMGIYMVGGGWVDDMWGRGSRDRNAGARVGGGRMTGGAGRGLVLGLVLWVGARRCGRGVGRSKDDKAKLVKKRTLREVGLFRNSLDSY
jgi:hypothetical protein